MPAIGALPIRKIRAGAACARCLGTGSGMSLSVLRNASAAVANRFLASNDAGVTRSVVQLAAGTRVPSARDDAASLAVGSRLRAEVVSLAQPR